MLKPTTYDICATASDTNSTLPSPQLCNPATYQAPTFFTFIKPNLVSMTADSNIDIFLLLLAPLDCLSCLGWLLKVLVWSRSVIAVTCSLVLCWLVIADCVGWLVIARRQISCSQQLSSILCCWHCAAALLTAAAAPAFTCLLTHPTLLNHNTLTCIEILKYLQYSFKLRIVIADASEA